MSAMVVPELIENRIFLIRGQKVMIDRDLAWLYDVSTKRINEQVKRNIKRFPMDFMFQLNKKETIRLVANCDRFRILKHSTSLPYVFTEHGVAMLSSVLNSDRAIEVNIQIVRAFIRLRQILSTHKQLVRKIKVMEKRYDHQFKVIFEAIRRMMIEEEKPKPGIGFHVKV